MQSVGQSHLPKVVPNHLPPTYCRVDMGRYGIFSLIINSARLGETSKNTEKNRIGHVGKRKEYRLNYLYKTNFSIPHIYFFAAASASIPLSAKASLFQILEWTSGSNISAGGSRFISQFMP